MITTGRLSLHLLRPCQIPINKHKLKSHHNFSLCFERLRVIATPTNTTNLAKLGDLKHNKIAKWPTYAVMYTHTNTQQKKGNVS